MIESLGDALLVEAEQLIAILPRLLFSLLVVFAIYTLGKWLAAGTVRFLKRSSIPETYHDYFRKLIKSIGAFVAFVVFLNMIGYQALAASLLAGGGLTAVMLGFAFKDIGENFLAGFLLAFSRPFSTDDIIESEGIVGKVRGISLRHTHIRARDGSDVFVPSSQLFTRPLKNYTLDGLRRDSFIMSIDYKEDTEEVISLLRETVKSTKGVLHSPAVSVNIKEFKPNVVELEICFWIRAKDQELTLSTVRTRVMNNCKKVLTH